MFDLWIKNLEWWNGLLFGALHWWAWGEFKGELSVEWGSFALVVFETVKEKTKSERGKKSMCHC